MDRRTLERDAALDRRPHELLELHRTIGRQPAIRIVARIELTTCVAASPERCFDLARSVDLHTRSTSATGERAVGGVTTGLLGLGQEVTWRARHFGVRQELTSRITAYDRPRHFRDSMVRGAFRRFDHDHFFEQTPTGCTIVMP